VTKQPATSDLVVIDAKRVDSDEVAETTVEVVVPDSELGQRRQLTDLVHALYPDAEFRSFANEAASFLDYKLLIVAVYRRTPDDSREIVEDDSQQRLFSL